eukprot:TRINITY_DN9284_c0_g4_i1.p1 TRINITY_DN9284_c0_g4~~TRINITY_DN9284_c0_g4_i1.p1  ORF type:complete len:1631 (+),score=390.21 TRINITY_DN9284_c0_g4_i1:109-5001(+)
MLIAVLWAAAMAQSEINDADADAYKRCCFYREAQAVALLNMQGADPETDLMRDGARRAASELGVELREHTYLGNYNQALDDLALRILDPVEGLLLHASDADEKLMQALSGLAALKPIMAVMVPDVVVGALGRSCYLHVGARDADVSAQVVPLLPQLGRAGQRVWCVVDSITSAGEMARCQGIVAAGGVVHALHSVAGRSDSEVTAALVSELQSEPPVTGLFAASAGAARVVGRALAHMADRGLALPHTIAHGLTDSGFWSNGSARAMLFAHTVDPGAWSAGYMAVHSMVTLLHTGNVLPSVGGAVANLHTGPTLHRPQDFTLKPRLRCQALHQRVVLCPEQYPAEGAGSADGCACVNRTQDIRLAINQHQAGSTSQFWQVVEAGVEHFFLGLGRDPPVLDYRRGGDDGIWDPPRQAERLAEQLALRPAALGVTVPHPAVAAVTREAGRMAATGVFWTFNAGWGPDWVNLTEGSQHPMHLGQDEFQAGQEAAHGLGGSDAVTTAVCILHQPGDNLLQRCLGFDSVWGGHVTILQTGREHVFEELVQSVEAFMVANPGTKTVFTLGPTGLDAFIIAAERVGVDVTTFNVATIDFSERVPDAIRSGVLRFAVHQQQYLQGYYTVMGLYAGVLTHSWNTQGSLLPTGPQLITKENIDKYSCEPLLYPLCELPETAPERRGGGELSGVEIAIISAAASSLVLAALGFLWYTTRERRQLRKLYDNNRIAEEMAEKIAAMRLEELSYLELIENPNRIQTSLLEILRMLRLYKRFLPEEVLHLVTHGDDPPAPDDGDVSASGSSRRIASDPSERRAPSAAAACNAVQRVLMDCRINVRTATAVCVAATPSTAGGRCGSRLSHQDDPWEDWLTATLGTFREYGGTVGTYSFDRVEVTWNAHRTQPQHAARAALCCLRLGQAMWDQQVNLPWTAGAGTGTVRAGNVGDAHVRRLVCGGQNMAVADALMRLGRIVSATTLVCQNTRARISNLQTRPVDVVPSDLRGSRGSTEMVIFEVTGEVLAAEGDCDALLLGRAELPSPSIAALKAPREADSGTYLAGFAAFSASKWADAVAKFTEYLKAKPTDGQAARLLKLAIARNECSSIADQGRYVRRLRGWEEFELKASKVALPDGLEDTITSLDLAAASPGSANASFGRGAFVPRLAAVGRSDTDAALLSVQVSRALGRSECSELTPRSGFAQSPRSTVVARPAGGQPPISAFVARLQPRENGTAEDPPTFDSSTMSDGGGASTCGRAATFSSTLPEPTESTILGMHPQQRRFSVEQSAENTAGSSAAGIPQRPRRRPSSSSGSSTSSGPRGGLRRMGGPPVSTDETLGGTIQQTRRESGASGKMPDNNKEFVDTNGRQWCRSGKALGKGAFGSVWMGMSADGALVALKMLPLPQEGRQNARVDEEILDLIQEVDLLSNLQHANIVAYCGSAVVGRHIIVIMEYLPGGSLATLLEQFGGKVLRTSAQRYTKDMLWGLEFLHDQQIVHRDFKPGNVLLQIDGQCKLADFGASAVLTAASGTGRVIGTPLWMAPEASEGSVVFASDIWGLGITVIEMLAGEKPAALYRLSGPFNTTAFLRQLAKRGGDETFGPHIPDSLRADQAALEFVEGCLVREAAKRPTARDLLCSTFLLE